MQTHTTKQDMYDRALEERRRDLEFQYTASNDASGLLNFASDASADEDDSFIDLDPTLSSSATATSAMTTTTTTTKTTPDELDESVLLPFSAREEPLANTEMAEKSSEMIMGSNDVEFILNEFPELENESRDHDETTTTTSASYSCAPRVANAAASSTDTETAAANRNDEKVVEHVVVRFDYNLLLSNNGDDDASSGVDSILRDLQENLLDRVGSALDDVGLCRTDGRKDRRRYLTEQVVLLEEISSLPSDEVLDSGVSCAKDNGDDDDTACYPIAGYMTAYYYNVKTATTTTARDASITTTADDIEMTIRDIVQRDMESQSLISTQEDGGGTITARAYYVGDRGGGIITNRTNLLPRQPPSSIHNGAEDDGAREIPLVAGGMLAATIVVLLFAALLALRWKKNRRGGGYGGNKEDDDDAHRDMKVTSYPPPPLVDDVYTIDSKLDPKPPSNEWLAGEEDDATHWLQTSFTTDTDSTPIVSNRTGAVSANDDGRASSSSSSMQRGGGYAGALSSYFDAQNRIEEESDWEDGDSDIV